MFVQTNNKIICLKNVSNINVLPERYRIIFNMNYSIEIECFTKSSNVKKQKLISDYVYWDCLNREDLLFNINYLKNEKYFGNNFIAQPSGKGFINKNEISSVKYSDKKKRVIFNLSHPVTFTDFDGNDKITSEFVYVNCDDYKAYKKYVEFIQFVLKGEI